MSAWSAWALDINRWGHFLTPCLILIHSHTGFFTRTVNFKFAIEGL